MTTTKQLNYLNKLANWKSKSVPLDIENWSDSEASALIDEWKALKSEHGDAQTQILMRKIPATRSGSKEPVRCDVNGVRLGLAFKIVMGQKMIDQLDIADMQSICERVWLVYQLSEAADGYVEARLNKERALP